MSVLPPLRIRVRLFAMQRETAGMRELRLEVPSGATVDDAWDAVVAVVPALAPGRASLRFAVNGEYADPDDGRSRTATRSPASRRSAAARARRGRGGPRTARAAPADPRAPRGAVRRRPRRGARGPAGHRRGRGRGRVHRPDPRITPGPRRPARRPRRRGTPGGEVEGLEYEAFEPHGPRGARRDRGRDRGALRRAAAAIVHRTGDVPLGEASVLVVAVGAPPGRGLRGGPLRDRRDEGPGADLEGRALRGRARLDRARGADRTGRARGSGRPSTSRDPA